MRIRELIKIADKGYGMGPGFVEASFCNDRCGGDTLAAFIALELSETFEKGIGTEAQLARGIQVMEAARDDIQGVIDALEKARGREI